MTGVIVNGVYYPNPNKAPQHRMANVGTQMNNYNISSQARTYDRELIQPYDKDGKPNPDFYKQYPELAKEYGMEDLL